MRTIAKPTIVQRAIAQRERRIRVTHFLNRGPQRILPGRAFHIASLDVNLLERRLNPSPLILFGKCTRDKSQHGHANE